MSIQEEFLEYLHSQVPQRMALSTHLGGDGRVCSYYICPLSTLRKIVEKGIYCRRSPAECIDLSSPDVQSRRKTVWLGRSDAIGRMRWRKDVPIHSCVNLFWNPLNRTFDAFQRNGLIRAAEKNETEHGIICLLELDAERLLNKLGAYWTSTKGNAASSAFASVNMTELRQFPWADTFAIGDYTKEHPWQPRAAELIVFLDGSGQQYTDPIPLLCFTRVLISSEVQLTEQQQKWLSSTGLHCHRANVFKSASSLLKAERKFVRDVAEYCLEDKDCVSRLVAAFRIVTEFESTFGGPTADLFASPSMAHSHHGIGHVTRVMFWSAFLGTYPFGQSVTSYHIAAILAALLHDLGRQEAGEDLGHGERTLKKHRNLIEKALDDQSLRESCLSAVQMHGIDDSECPEERRDRVWALLKDADGLERGRFRTPGNNGRGCNPEMLRLGYLSNTAAARKRIPWLAYQLAGITKHSQWGKRPCRRLLKDFFYGLSLGPTHGLFQGEGLAVAQRLCQELSALLEELVAQDEYMEWAELDAAYTEFAETWEEEPLYDAEPEQELPEWMDSNEDNDWDDHDVDWEDFYQNDN